MNFLKASLFLVLFLLSIPSVSGNPQDPLPSAPTLLSATPGNSKVTLTWSAVSGAMYYTVKYGTSTGVYDHTVLSGSQSAFDVQGLTNGATYFFTVQANNASGSSPPSNELSATTPAPPVPYINSVSGGTNQIALNWTAAAGATSYSVKYGTTPGNYTTTLNVGTATQHTVTGLPSGTTYFVVVEASNSSGTSPNSIERSAITLPDAPTLLTATPGNTKVNLTWAPVPGAMFYKVKYGTTPGVYSQTVTISAGTSFEATSLTNNVAYYFAVNANTYYGAGPASNELSATPYFVPPILNTATASNAQVTLSWTSLYGASGYKVKYGTTSGSYTTTIDVGNVSTFTKTGLTNGTPYYFVVTATNGVVESSSSDEKSATPAIIPPGAPLLKTTTVGDHAIRLAWGYVGGATGYKIKYGTASGVYTTTIQTGVVLSYQVINLTNGTPYYFAVTAINGGGESSLSNQLSATPQITTGSPSAVTNLQAQSANASVVLTWSAPANNGFAITGYQIQYGTTASGGFATLHMDNATPGATITGLNNYVAYQFRVIAINVKGTSNASNVAIATPYTGTAVSAGELTTRTWTLAGSPYVINGEVSITSEAVLTIEAGVQVKFNGNYALTVNGILNSLGTESQRVVFTSAKPVPAKGDWRALQVNNPANKLQFLTVEYSDLGIFVITRHPVVNNPVIRNNIVRFNNNGIFFQPSTAPIIVNNTVFGNTYGINAFCNIFTGCAPTIVQNSILGNTTYNMFVQGGNAGLVIKAENNWWGSTDQNTIAASIFDHVDQASQATVDFIPYLTSLPQEQGVALTNLSVSNVFVNMRTMSSVNINYAISKNANVTIKIYDASGPQGTPGVIVRTLLNNQARTVGSHAESWDFKNNSLQFLPSGMYFYRIEAVGTDGSFDFYGPNELLPSSNHPTITNTTITPTLAFSPAKGDRVKIEFNLDQPALVSVGFEGDTFIKDQPLNAGPNVSYWDGYNSVGLMSFYQNTVSVDAVAKRIPDWAIILDRGRTLDIPIGQADPYIIRPLYNEISTLNYSITEPASVTVKVLTSDGGTLLNILENNVSKSAGSYQIVFDGRDANGATIAEEGDYRLRIEAVDSYGVKATRDVSVRILP